MTAWPTRPNACFNLIALLLNTSRPLAPGRDPPQDPRLRGVDVAFRRMFERDKEEIRELGLPLELVGGRLGGRRGLPDPKGSGDDPRARPHGGRARGAVARGASLGGPGGSRRPRSGADEAFSGGRCERGAGRPGDPWFRARGRRLGSGARALFDAIARKQACDVPLPHRRRGRGARAKHRSVRAPASRRVVPRRPRPLRNEIRHFKLERIDGHVSVAAGKRAGFREPPRASRPRYRAGRGHRGLVGGAGRLRARAAWWVARRTGAEARGRSADAWVE